jgi:hypothetical protein
MRKKNYNCNYNLINRKKFKKIEHEKKNRIKINLITIKL